MDNSTAMTPNEKKLFYEMQSDIKEMRDAILGNKLTKEPGMADRLSKVEERQERIEALVKRIVNLLIGIAIGCIIMGIVFGFLSWKDLFTIVKTIK